MEVVEVRIRATTAHRKTAGQRGCGDAQTVAERVACPPRAPSPRRLGHACPPSCSDRGGLWGTSSERLSGSRARGSPCPLPATGRRSRSGRHQSAAHRPHAAPRGPQPPHPAGRPPPAPQPLPGSHRRSRRRSLPTLQHAQHWMTTAGSPVEPGRRWPSPPSPVHLPSRRCWGAATAAGLPTSEGFASSDEQSRKRHSGDDDPGARLHPSEDRAERRVGASWSPRRAARDATFGAGCCQSASPAGTTHWVRWPVTPAIRSKSLS